MITSCIHNNTITTDRKFIFRHYLRHLRKELDDLAEGLGINKPYSENRFSLINTIVDTSTINGRF